MSYVLRSRAVRSLPCFVNAHVGMEPHAKTPPPRSLLTISCEYFDEKRLRQFRGELFTLFISWQRLDAILCRVALQYAEFPSLSAEIFSANCLIHRIACCHHLVTLKSRLGLDKQPRILDHSSRPHKIPVRPNFSLVTFLIWLLMFFIALHFISFIVSSCIVLFCSAVVYLASCYLTFWLYKFSKPESEYEYVYIGCGWC